MSHPFQTGGALLADSPVYVERKADHEALAHLRNMAYLLVIEPRQQGKTSLINHLMCHPALDDVAFAYVDVTTPDRSTEATWYQTLCPRILRQLRGFIPRDQWPTIPQDSVSWREFLCDVATFATDVHRRVVIALDEIGAVTFPGATEFFSVLRDVYNSRQAETEFKRLAFLLIGAFHPRDLIKDDKISPFNIAQRVRLADFTLAQVRELVGKGSWSDEQVVALAKRIHYWTDGQPYLTQLLCSYPGPDATSANVDAGVERLRREDENHLPPLIDRLNSDERLHRYVRRILAGERIKFYPRENRRQARLELLGVVKAGADGFCRIRNRVYEEVLMPMDSSTRTLRIEPEINPPPSELPTIWKRLIVANQTGERVTGCLAQVLSIKRLDQVADSAGQPLPGFEAGWLSWAPAEFKPATIQPGQTRPLDLVWKQPCEPWLRVASSPRPGVTRQQDTIVYEKTDRVKIRESGQYLIRLRIETAELPPIEKGYLFFWDGSHCDFQVAEVWPLEQSRSPVPPRSPVSPPSASGTGGADQQHLPRALKMARRTLAILEEQAAGFGKLHVPAHLRIELEEKQREVAELEARLGGAPPAPGQPIPSSPMPAPSALKPTPVSGTGLRQPTAEGGMPDSYLDLQIRIQGLDLMVGVYQIEALLGDGSHFEGGVFRLDQDTLKAAELDPQEYGVALFEALFSGPMLRAYDRAIAYADVKTEGRLRIRLWIDNDAAELHALAWERLHHLVQGAALPVATSGEMPFSRYVGLETREPAPITKRPVRVLFAVSSPADLSDYGLASLDVEKEAASLLEALDDLRQAGELQVTLMPGRTGLPGALRARSEREGYRIREGPTSMDNIVQMLSRDGGYHVLHYLGHGAFDRSRQHAVLFLEDDGGSVERVTDETLATLLKSAGPSLRLVFLAACESARRDPKAGNPFVGLAPKLVQVGIPAVVAMQDLIPVVAARKFARDFYSYLLEHGVVDRAMNQARLLLFESGRAEWAIPVLFTRLKEGRLFLPGSRYGFTARAL